MVKDGFDSICVFCGSSQGHDKVYGRGAESLGTLMAERKITLVYGGGDAGLMGMVSRSHFENGGKTVGIITKSLEKMVPHRTGVELRVVENMHERKNLMYNTSQAFIALPGGIGTLEELFEVFTWNQLGIMDKPLGLLNSGGYFDFLLDFLDSMVERGFLREAHRDRLVVSEEAEDLLEKMRNVPGGYVGKWGK
jgi:uncharacterized protein (TIGR00730 family)